MNLNKISLLCLFCLLYCAGYTQTYIESSVSLGSFTGVENELQDYYVEDGIQHLLIEIQGENFQVTDGTLFTGASDVVYAQVDTSVNIILATQFG